MSGVPFGEISIGTRRFSAPGSLVAPLWAFAGMSPLRTLVFPMGAISSVLGSERELGVVESERLPSDRERLRSVLISSVPLSVPSDSGSSEKVGRSTHSGRHAANCSNANRPFSSSTSRQASEQYRLPLGPYTPPRLV
jgi:hypothetical protein